MMRTFISTSLSTAQTLIEAAAILAFSLSGLLESAHKKLDIVGVCTVVGLAAFGGWCVVLADHLGTTE